jgi:RNA recognition motif-containing protein
MLGGLFKSKKNAASEVQELFSRAMVIEEPAEQPPLEEPVTKVVQEKYQEPALVEQEELSRTGRVVFVGNVALECTLKEIARHFRPYGNVERVWFRSVPVDRKDKKIPIRAAVIIKQFQQGAKVKNCYVLFDSVEVQAHEYTRVLKPA